MNKETEEAINTLKEMLEKSRDLIEEDFGKLIGIHQIQAVATILNYIKEIEENKNLKDTDLIGVYLKGVYDGQEKITTKIRKRIEELKNKSGGNVFHIQQTINAEIILLEEILKEREK